ncbi:LysR family transcriptional regulator [Shimia sp.]|uniref:LysR family transcriptional regulator n=1 Tax=Shimia sp. TaxID=1954381 RepID=UPI00356448AD
MNLTIRQLATFVEIMHTGSFSEAARNLGRTQPAVSAMIQTLEAELGFALFLREPGSFRPTPEARFFLEEAEDILDRLERTKRTISGVARREHGELRIACHPAASGFFVPEVLTGMLKDRPEVSVTLKMRSSPVIEDLIASRQFDIGFAETPVPRNSIDQTDFDLGCVCAVHRDDSLARLSRVSPADIGNRAFCGLFDDHTITRQTRAAFERAGIAFRRRFELQTFLPGLRYVDAGLGVMICDKITASSHMQIFAGRGNIVFRPFEPRISSSVSILTPAQRPKSLLADEFTALLSARIRAIGEDPAFRSA